MSEKEKMAYRFSDAEAIFLDRLRDQIRSNQAILDNVLQLIAQQQGLAGKLRVSEDGRGFIQEEGAE